MPGTPDFNKLWAWNLGSLEPGNTGVTLNRTLDDFRCYAMNNAGLMKKINRSPSHRGKTKSRIANRPHPYANLVTKLKSRRTTPYEAMMVSALEEIWPSAGLEELSRKKVTESKLKAFFWELNVYLHQFRMMIALTPSPSIMKFKSSLFQTLEEVRDWKTNQTAQEFFGYLDEKTIASVSKLIEAADSIANDLQPQPYTREALSLMAAGEKESIYKTSARFGIDERALLVSLAATANQLFGYRAPALIIDLLESETIKRQLPANVIQDLTRDGAKKTIQRATKEEILANLADRQGTNSIQS